MRTLSPIVKAALGPGHALEDDLPDPEAFRRQIPEIEAPLGATLTEAIPAQVDQSIQE